MGLDITAYTGLTKVESPQRDEDGWPEDYLAHFRSHRVKYTEHDFPGRAQGLEHDVIYKHAGRLAFPAGSYSGYNHWRNWLAEVAGYASASAVWANPPPAGSPFLELINFSDCEGVIGPVVAAKLAKDFADFRDEAQASAKDTEEPLLFEQYCKWQQAFEMAANNGAVDFH